MPYSKQTFNYTTGARTFTLALASDYDLESNIKVYVVGELTGGGDQIFRTFTFDSEFVINVTEALDNPSEVVVQRTVSPTVFSVDFEAGADVTKRNLQLAFRQQFFLLQEILDGRIDGVDIDQRAEDAETAAAAALVSEVAAAASASSIDADEIILRDGSVPFTAKITGVAPTADLHLSTKKYVDDVVGGGGVMLLDGTNQMIGELKLKAQSPTLDDHATRKKYVVDLLALKAPLAGPTFTGNVVVPDQSADDNSTKAANTKYVDAAVVGAGEDWTFVATFYDNGIDGDLASAETPTLADGFEYSILVDQLGNNNASSVFLQMDFSRTTGGYDSQARNTWFIGTASAATLAGWILFPTARVALDIQSGYGGLYNSITAVATHQTHVADDGVFKVNKVKMSTNIGSFEAGKLHLYRKAL